MAKETKKTPETEPETPEIQPDASEVEAPAETPEAEAAAPDDAEPAADPAADPAARIATLEAEAAELKDKLLRAMAETENIRHRAVRDRQDASKYAIANFAREMVTVADNLGRALEHVSAEARAETEAVESLAAGVEMTERAMVAALERFGVKLIEAMGKKFDHNLHEAMYEVEDPSQPAGTVVHEMEKGYTLEDRLLRPARVGVSKGGSAAETPVEAEADEPGTEDMAAAKDQRGAYEKQSDAQGDSTDTKGGKLDEQL